MSNSRVKQRLSELNQQYAEWLRAGAWEHPRGVFEKALKVADGVDGRLGHYSDADLDLLDEATNLFTPNALIDGIKELLPEYQRAYELSTQASTPEVGQRIFELSKQYHQWLRDGSWEHPADVFEQALKVADGVDGRLGRYSDADVDLLDEALNSFRPNDLVDGIKELLPEYRRAFEGGEE